MLFNRSVEASHLLEILGSHVIPKYGWSLGALVGKVAVPPGLGEATEEP